MSFLDRNSRHCVYEPALRQWLTKVYRDADGVIIGTSWSPAESDAISWPTHEAARIVRDACAAGVYQPKLVEVPSSNTEEK